jgi:hypothetical protein
LPWNLATVSIDDKIVTAQQSAVVNEALNAGYRLSEYSLDQIQPFVEPRDQF